VAAARWCADNAKGLVIGTTGLTNEQRRVVDEAATKVGVVIAANYSVGAVLSEKFAALAAPYFDRVEIIELHHDKKVDAPSERRSPRRRVSRQRARPPVCPR